MCACVNRQSGWTFGFDSGSVSIGVKSHTLICVQVYVQVDYAAHCAASDPIVCELGDRLKSINVDYDR